MGERTIRLGLTLFNNTHTNMVSSHLHKSDRKYESKHRLGYSKIWKEAVKNKYVMDE